MRLNIGPWTIETRAAKGGSSGVSNPSQWIIDWLGAAKSVTGLDVHETTAMQANAVYACVKVLAETMGTIPLPLYHRRSDGGKERAPEHPLYRLLHDLPNPEMTSVDFRQCMMGHLLLWGNAYAEIERDVSGRPIALWPLRPDRMNIWRSFDTRDLRYIYSLYTGGVATLDPMQVLHIKNLSIDGIRGLSPIAHQREAVAVSLALEQFAASFFGNDASPGGFLSHPGTLNDKARENLKKGWEGSHKGLSNSHRMGVLEEGVTWQKVGVPPEDAQFIASRQYQLTEIARMYRVPMHLLSELGRVTHANIEHMGIDFVTHTVRPYAVNWEMAIAQKLIMPAEYADYFAEFNLEGLLRGDLASRYQSYATGRQWGWLSPNEIRDKENMNPISDEDGGNDYLVPMNMGKGGPPIPAVTTDTPEPVAQPPSPEDPNNRSLAWQRLFKRELETVLRREKADVLEKARKLLRHGDQRGFQRWLVTFYDQDHPRFIEERMLTLFEPEEEAFAHEFLEDFALRHSQRSLQTLQQLLQSQNGESLPALEAKFGEWEGSRALETVKTERFRLRIVPQVEKRAQEAVLPPITIQQGDIVFPEGFLKAEITVPERSITLNNDVQAPPAPQVDIHNTFEGDRTLVQASPAPQVDIHNTFQSPTVEVAAPVVDVKAPISVEQHFESPKNIITVDQPDITFTPEMKVTMAPAPPQAVEVLYDESGKVIGTETRALGKPLPPKLKAQKAQLRKKASPRP